MNRLNEKMKKFKKKKIYINGPTIPRAPYKPLVPSDTRSKVESSSSSGQKNP